MTAQQQTTLQQSVVQANNAPRVNANSINFQVRSGIAVPSNVTVASVSAYPALIDVFPAYRGDSFFVVEDEVVIVGRDRRIVDVIPAGPRARYAGGGGGGGSGAAVDLPTDDVRVIQRVLIDCGLLQGDADGVWGPATREAITVYQRQQGIAVTGSIDMRTVSSLGVSNRLSQQATESIQSQSSSTDAQTSTDSQTTTGQARSGQTGQPVSQQNATGQSPHQDSGRAQNPRSSTTGQSMPNRSETKGPANPPSQSGSSSTDANQSTSPNSSSDSGSTRK